MKFCGLMAYGPCRNLLTVESDPDHISEAILVLIIKIDNGPGLYQEKGGQYRAS